MTARITISMTANGIFELYINPEGRDLLVQKLQNLNEKNEHFHLGTWEGAEVQLKATPYNSTDTIFDTGKVLFRLDDWDKNYFPHVIEKK